MTTPEKFVAKLEQFINETRSDVLALDVVLKVLITRLLPPEKENQFLSEVEQQCLHTIQSYEVQQQEQIKTRMHAFFHSLQDWYRKEKTTVVPPSSVVQ
jgi:hypothetical protein